MAWIIGLADDAEIARIKRAGYEVNKYDEMPDIGYFATPQDNDRGIAVFVDCDVQDLLNLTEENEMEESIKELAEAVRNGLFAVAQAIKSRENKS